MANRIKEIKANGIRTMQIEVQRSGEIVPSHGGPRAGSGRTPGAKTKQQPITERAPRVLTAAEERERWRKALEMAESKGDAKTMALILQNIHENRRGRPFVSSDPRARREPANDRSLIVAIQNMLPAPKAEKKRK